MKRRLLRIFTLILALVIAPSALAELSVEEAAQIARQDLQIYSGLTDAEMAEFQLSVQEAEDFSHKGWGISRNAQLRCEALPGIEVGLSMVYMIDDTDGQIRYRGDVYFDDGADFAWRYREFKAYRASLAAQQQLEGEKGPFRSWSEADQMAFYAQYGRHDAILEAYLYPGPEEVQSWEVVAAARQFLLDAGHSTGELDARSVELGHRWNEFQANFWFVNFVSPVDDAASILLKVHYQDGEILKIEYV